MNTAIDHAGLIEEIKFSTVLFFSKHQFFF